MTTAQSAYFKKWYAKNKEKLASARKKRYSEDPAYKDEVLKRGRERCKKKKKEREASVPKGMLTLYEAAERIGVNHWVLRYWREAEYCPQPKKINNRFYYSELQVESLIPLRDFTKGRRVSSPEAKAKLDAVVGLIFANWD